MRTDTSKRLHVSVVSSVLSSVRDRNRTLLTCPRQATVRVPLGGQLGGYAVVDAKDLSRVKGYRWTHYIGRRPNGKTYHYAQACAGYGRHAPRVSMHCLILPLRRGEVDHWNGDGLDNRRRNLRKATRQTNAWNQPVRRNSTTQFKGVAVVVDRKRRPYAWKAHICVSYKKKHLGCFRSPEAAARAYDRAARYHFGSFACLNFPRRGERGART